MSRFECRRARALRAVVLALLAGARNAVAGWFTLIPLTWVNLLNIVVMGVLVAVVVIVAVSAGPGWPGGPGGGTSGQTGMDDGPVPPDGGGSDASGGPGPQSRRGSLEIRFEGNVDFRELRYSLRYHAGEPAVPGERLYLRGLREADDRVRAVDAAEIQQDPGRYAALAEQPESLCRRGFALSAGSPSCQGVLRISPSYTRMVSARGVIRALAAEAPPIGPDGPQDAIGAVQAQATLRLAHAFFVVSSGPPSFRSRVTMVEQDPDMPQLFRPAAATVDGDGQPALDAVWRLDLSRDRGRLYLMGPGSLAEWRGSGPLRTLYRSDPGESLRDATPTDAGVCVAYFREQQSGMRCLAQDRDNWSPAQPFPRDMLTVDLASVGRGVLALGSEAGAQDQPIGYYVPDASQFWLQFREAPVAPEGAQGVEASMPIKRWLGPREDYLLFGPYPNQRQGFWQLGMLEFGAERSPSFFLQGPQGGDGPAPGGGHWLRSRDLWQDVAPGVVRVLALSDALEEVDYSLLAHRPLRSATRALALEAVRLDTLRLLDGEGREKLLAVAGLRAAPPRSFVALLRYANAASGPELLGLVDFSDPAQAQRPARFQARVREISRDAMFLRPEA